MMSEISEEIGLGFYFTKNGRNYDNYFYPKHGLAISIGPVPQNLPAHCGIVVEIYASSKEEAKKKLIQEINKIQYHKEAS